MEVKTLQLHRAVQVGTKESIFWSAREWTIQRLPDGWYRITCPRTADYVDVPESNVKGARRLLTDVELGVKRGPGRPRKTVSEQPLKE